MRLFWSMALGALILVSGCHSAVIDAALTNATSEPMRLIEVDYPSASFGTQSLAPGQSFHYRFKVLGSGAMKLVWTDAERQEHTVTGPTLSEGLDGALSIVVGPTNHVDWRTSFKANH